MAAAAALAVAAGCSSSGTGTSSPGSPSSQPATGPSGTAQPSPASSAPADSQGSASTPQQSAEAVQGPAAVPTAAQLSALNAQRAEIAKLSPEQLAGQRVVYSYNGLKAPAGPLNLIRHGDVGGVIFFSFNISSQVQLRGVIRQMIAANSASSNPARQYPLLRPRPAARPPQGCAP
jgi:beta-N-acetylhexosaminidase